jgi:hypothetical protein
LSAKDRLYGSHGDTIHATSVYRILLASGDTLAWRHFAVGSSVNIYNRVYHLHGCDAFTHDFMAAQGLPQKGDMPVPQDPYHHNLQQQAQRNAVAKQRIATRDKPTDSRYYLENARKVRACVACSLHVIVTNITHRLLTKLSRRD